MCQHRVNIVTMSLSSLTVVSGGCEVVLQSQLALCTLELEDVLFHCPTTCTHQPQDRHIPACMYGGGIQNE